jgi:hypothetical protein
MVESNKRDRYGRTVGKVLVHDRDVGLEQIYAPAWRGIIESTSESSRRKIDEPMRRPRPRHDRRAAVYGMILHPYLLGSIVIRRERNHERAREHQFPPTPKVFPYLGVKTAGCITVVFIRGGLKISPGSLLIIAKTGQKEH